MGEIVDLRDRQPVSHEGEFNSELVTDLARFAEGLVTEKDIKRRYRFDDATWESLNNDALIAAVSDEKTRRVRSGALKRERAQALVTQAPDVLGEILLAKDANPRHRIDSAKLLNDFSANGPEAVPAADRFIINIVLNADNSGSETATLTFNKRITPLEPGEVDPDDVSSDTGMIAAIAAKKTTENGGGQESI
jgi:hypothetical protein